MLYRKQYNDELEENNEDKNPKQEGGDPNLDQGNSEEGSWKKRHGDLRRYTQKEKETLQAQIDELKDQLKEAQKSTVKYPKTQEELEAWKVKYPDLGKILDTMILKHIEGSKSDFEGKFDRVKELEARIEKDRVAREKEIAYGKLLDAHPDFEQFKDTDEFQDWIDKQSKWVQNALWENETDAQSAIDAVDLFKTRTKRNSKNDNRDAARQVARPKNSSPDANGEKIYSESMLSKMSAAEYERVGNVVSEQIKNGTFVYDITNAA